MYTRFYTPTFIYVCLKPKKVFAKEILYLFVNHLILLHGFVVHVVHHILSQIIFKFIPLLTQGFVFHVISSINIRYFKTIFVFVQMHYSTHSNVYQYRYWLLARSNMKNSTFYYLRKFYKKNNPSQQQNTK